MKNFLEQIVVNIKNRHQENFSRFSPLAFLDRLPLLKPKQHTRENVLNQVQEKFFLIAECKKASPSQGDICQNYHPSSIARSYEAGGASAVSVLTEEKFFKGSPAHLQEVRDAVSLPILWKDFVIHEYQIARAREMEADLLLLIFRILPDQEIKRLIDFTLTCGLLPLVEVFQGDDPADIIELANRYPGQFLIGINNRDLSSFTTDLAHGEEMLKKLFSLCGKFSFISESGIKSQEDIRNVKKLGFRGALVGESLMKENDPALALKTLLSN